MSAIPVPKLVIFDCDGVLVDSEPLANRIFTKALNEIGFEIELEEACREFIGRSMPSCIELVERRLGRAVPEGFVDKLQERTFEAFRGGLEPVLHVIEALDRIPFETCVASSGEPEKMRFTLGHTGLLPRFEGRLFSAMEVRRGKPAPDLFLHAAEKMGAAPGGCVVVEDSFPGVQGALAAGMRVLAYCSRADAAPMVQAGAEPFEDMRDLPGLLGC